MRPRSNSPGRLAHRVAPTLLALAALVLFLVAAPVIAAAPPSDRAHRMAADLLAALRASPRADLASRADLQRADVGEGVTVHGYPGLEPRYSLHPLRAEGRTFGAIAIDSQASRWCWYTLRYTGELLSATAPAVALREVASRAARLDVSRAEAPLAVRAPDRRIYWLVASRDKSWQVLVDADRPDLPLLSTADGSLAAHLAAVPKQARPPAPAAWKSPEAVRMLFVRPSVYVIPDVPYHFQETSWYCGPASTQMLLDHYGEEISQTDIGDVENDITSYGTFTDDNRRACHFSAMSASVQNPALQGYAQRGLGYAGNEAYLLADPYEQLKDQIARGVPVEICTCYDGGCTEGHFRVVKGYDDPLDEFIVHDPWYSSPFYGPDVHFNQEFLHDIWEPWSGCWGLTTGPWQVNLALPDHVAPGETFVVTATVRYPGEGAFRGEYPASDAIAEIVLPSGFSLVSGDPTAALPVLSSGDSTAAQWEVGAGSTEGAWDIGVRAKGIVSGSSGSYPSYQDSIGGCGRATIWVGEQAEPWSAAERITDGSGGSNLSYPSARTLYADPDGVLHLVWTDTRDGNSEIYYSRCAAGSWDPPTRLTEHAGDSSAPAITGTAAGVLHVAWSDVRDGNEDIYYRNWNGASWSAETRLSTNAAPDITPSIAADGAGNVYVVWILDGSLLTRLQYAKWNGSSWSAPANVGQVGSQSAFHPSVAADALGRIHLAYEQLGASRAPSEVYYKVYTGTWSAPFALSADPTYSRCPSIAAGVDGKIHVAWQDGRDSEAEIYIRACDGGSWGTETRLTEHAGDSQRVSIITDASGNIHVAWEDNRDGNAEIYYRSCHAGSWGSEERVSRECHSSTLPCITVESEGAAAVVWTDTRDARTEIYGSFRRASTVAVADGGIPPGPRLIQAVWPVPSRGGATIRFAVLEESPVLMQVFDVQGAHVRTLVRRVMPAGQYESAWDGRDAAGHTVGAGVYYCRLREGDRMEGRARVVLTR